MDFNSEEKYSLQRNSVFVCGANVFLFQLETVDKAWIICTRKLTTLQVFGTNRITLLV